LVGCLCKLGAEALKLLLMGELQRDELFFEGPLDLLCDCQLVLNLINLTQKLVVSALRVVFFKKLVLKVGCVTSKGVQSGRSGWV
jgi:hypothetical protein